MAALHCDFKSALRFLADLAGVTLASGRKHGEELAKTRREWICRRAEEAKRRAALFAALCETRREVLRLEHLRRNAENRLSQLRNNQPERFPGEAELVWEALKMVADCIPKTVAAYMVAAFSDQKTREKYAGETDERDALVARCMTSGGVWDDRGHFLELIL
jgi:hypothetical protein